MEKRSGQFGILALLVFTTVMAVSFAIIRLPLEFLPKMFCIMLLAVYFSRWALRDQERLGAPIRATLVLSISTFSVVRLIWARVRVGALPFWELEFCLAAVVLLWASFVVVYIIMLSRGSPHLPRCEHDGACGLLVAPMENQSAQFVAISRTAPH